MTPEEEAERRALVLALDGLLAIVELELTAEDLPLAEACARAMEPPIVPRVMRPERPAPARDTISGHWLRKAS